MFQSTTRIVAWSSAVPGICTWFANITSAGWLVNVFCCMQISTTVSSNLKPKGLSLNTMCYFDD